MLLELTKDGEPLFFEVLKGENNEVVAMSRLLADALYQASVHNAERIRVIAVSEGREEQTDILNVDEVLRANYATGGHTPIQYQYIENGGVEYED